MTYVMRATWICRREVSVEAGDPIEAEQKVRGRLLPNSTVLRISPRRRRGRPGRPPQESGEA